MVVQYGWAFLRAKVDDEEEYIPEIDDVDRLVRQIRERAQSLFDFGNPVVDVIPANGDYHLRITGKLNHRDQRHEDVLEFYRHVAREAPGSFGTLMVWDDEDKEGKHNEFVTYV
ncbi:MAG: Imm7 family immunity protein, partial [Myxococcota bacterium]